MPKPPQNSILGKETITDLMPPQDRLTQCYKALNDGNFDLMVRNWFHSLEAAIELRKTS